MQFELSLEASEGLSTRRITTLHLMLAFLLCGIGAGFRVLPYFTSVTTSFLAAFRPFQLFGIGCLVVGICIAVVAVFFRKWLLKGRNNLLLRSLEILCVGGASVWFLAGRQNIPAVIFGSITVLVLIATIWEAKKPKNQLAVFNENGIILPKANQYSKLNWDEIESVLLRHNILTIEMIGNKLIQRNMAQEPFQSEAIESFCKTQIQLHEKKRLAKADW